MGANNSKEIENPEVDAYKNAAYGALLGTLVGDAAGAVLEFRRGCPTQAQVDEALKLPGGGMFQLAPGQITDDGEMALCLAHALSNCSPTTFPGDLIVRQYARWVSSAPFAIGATTYKALIKTPELVEAHTDIRRSSNVLADQVTEKTAKACATSKANGALMRVSPLPIWAHRLPPNEIAGLARREAALTHGTAACKDANAAYAIAMAHLISHPGDAQGALQAAVTWAASSACEEVQGWLEESISGPAPPCDEPTTIGFVRWGFVHAFRHLRLRTSFRDALVAILLLGGDTDTNAAIVCAMVGALHGATAIPESLKRPVLSRTSRSAGGIQRPDFLCPGSVLPQLFECLWTQACSVPLRPAAADPGTATASEGVSGEASGMAQGVADPVACADQHEGRGTHDRQHEAQTAAGTLGMAGSDTVFEGHADVAGGNVAREDPDTRVCQPAASLPSTHAAQVPEANAIRRDGGQLPP